MTLNEMGITAADNMTLDPETFLEQITQTRQLPDCQLHVLESGEIIIDSPASTMWYESLDDAREGQPQLGI